MGGGNATPSGNFDVQDTPLPEPEHFPQEEEDGWGGDGVAMDGDAGMEHERGGDGRGDGRNSHREEEEERERRERRRRRDEEEDEEEERRRGDDKRRDVSSSFSSSSSSSSSAVVDDVALMENWVTERAFVRVRQQVRFCSSSCLFVCCCCCCWLLFTFLTFLTVRCLFFPLFPPLSFLPSFSTSSSFLFFFFFLFFSLSLFPFKHTKNIYIG